MSGPLRLAPARVAQAVREETRGWEERAPALHVYETEDDLEVGVFKTADADVSNDIELLPEMSKKWGLSFLINSRHAPTGRSAGSLGWAGLANTNLWIDRTWRVCGVFLSQVFPAYDQTAIDLLATFETEVYRAL